MTQKKKETEEKTSSNGHQSLSQLVLDRKVGKYKMIERISYWAKELRKQEEHRHLTQTEILELAMSEVLSGKVNEEDLDKKIKLAAATNGAVKKEADKKPAKKS
jgi:hypothetical protein